MDDVSLHEPEIDDLLRREVLVEEKLDGANVTVCMDDGVVTCSLRSGPDAMDRAGQLGPLRAWVGAHDEQLRSVLSECRALYGEWLLLEHTVPYDRLPAYLVVLDLWLARDFVPPGERDARCERAGLAVPPALWRGVPGSLDTLDRLMGTSRFGSSPMEGVVVRPLDGRPPHAAKLLRAGFDRLDDDAWRGGRPRNRVAEGASWH